MTTRYWLRSSVFNLLFYGLTALICLSCLPFLLFPRKIYLGVVHFFTDVVYFLEKYVLGLTYEIRGAEHLPESGPYLIAAKHQSAYETLKLHSLFPDPAIILKKELLKIPLWGTYLKKSDVIAIDRSSPEQAIKSIQDGARRMVKQSRPIIIFPQGTRVWPHETSAEKPYKLGVARIQEATNLPIIPMATNSGYFWPRSGWCKRPGQVVFQFLPPIEPSCDRGSLLKALDKKTERVSADLLGEAKHKEANRRRFRAVKKAIFTLLVFGAVYSAFWFYSAEFLKKQYSTLAKQISTIDRINTPVQITGFPGPMKFRIEKETIETTELRTEIQDISITGLPLPFYPILIQVGNVQLTTPVYKKLTLAHNFDVTMSIDHNHIHLHDANLKRHDRSLSLDGHAPHYRGKKTPDVFLTARLQNYQDFLKELVRDGALKRGTATFIMAALTSFDREGTAHVPLEFKNRSFYVGPIRVGSLAE